MSYKKVCKLFLEGKCRDDLCNDSHTQPNRPQGVGDFRFRGDNQSRGQDQSKNSYNNNSFGNDEENDFSRKQGICRNYQQGNCSYGNNCKFSHGDNKGNDSSQQNDFRKKEICRNFQNGFCKFGESCKHIHEGQGSQNNDNNEDNEERRAPAKRQQGICRNFQQGSCRFGDDCKYKHENEGGDNDNDDEDKDKDEKREPRKQGICRNFQQGSCRFGDDCKYKHEKEGGDNDDEDKDEKREPRKQGICRNFQQGLCKFGESCKYIHEKDGSKNDENEEENQPRKQGVCRNFQQGSCRFGDNCKYLHEGAKSGDGERKDLCRGFQQGFCKFGDRCKYSHEQEGQKNEEGKGNENLSASKQEQDILKNQMFKFSLIDLGESKSLVNPKEIFSIGQRKLVVFYENGFLILRMITKKSKEKLELLKKAKFSQSNQTVMEEEYNSDLSGVHFSQKGLLLEVLNQFQYPISKIKADKVFLNAKRWVIVTFQNPLTLSYGFISFDLYLCMKQMLTQTKCAAVNIAHSERITCAEFCLKNEIFAKLESTHNFTDQYKHFGTQNDLNDNGTSNGLTPQEEKRMKEEMKLQRKQDLIMSYIINIENEIREIKADLNMPDEDDEQEQENESNQEGQEDEKNEEENKKEYIELKQKQEILKKYQEIYDNLQNEYDLNYDENDNDEGDNQNENGDDEEEYDEDDDDGDNQNQGQNTPANKNISQSNRKQDSNYQQSEESFSFDEDMYEEDEELLEEIELEMDAAAMLNTDEDDDPQKSDLSDNFFFKSLIIESQYAKSLENLILFTSSKDGMVKVWSIENISEENKKVKEDGKELQGKQPQLQGNLQTGHVIGLGAGNAEEKKVDQYVKLDDKFEFKAEINEELTLQISDNILKRQIICSIKQLTILVKSVTPEPPKLNRILMLGGEQGVMFSLGLNFSLSKASKIGNKDQRIDEFYISKQNQIFCILNSYESSQILQLGHDSSSLITEETQRHIDSFCVQTDEDSKNISFYYGNGNKLVMLKTKVPEKKVPISEEEQLQTKLQEIQNEITAQFDQDPPQSNEKKAEEDSNKENSANDKDQENKNDSNPSQKNDEKGEKKEFRTITDFTQSYKIDSGDEKLFSKELRQHDKIQRILEVKIKNQTVLFAFVINKFNQITQDCYLVNFECKSNQRDSFRQRNFQRGNGNTRDQDNDRSRSRSAFKSNTKEDFKSRFRAEGQSAQKDSGPSSFSRFGGITSHLSGNNRGQRRSDDNNEGRQDDQGRSTSKQFGDRNPRGRNNRFGNSNDRNDRRNNDNQQNDQNGEGRKPNFNPRHQMGKSDQRDNTSRDSQFSRGRGGSSSGFKKNVRFDNNSRGGGGFSKPRGGRSNDRSWKTDKIQQ